MDHFKDLLDGLVQFLIHFSEKSWLKNSFQHLLADFRAQIDSWKIHPCKFYDYSVVFKTGS